MLTLTDVAEEDAVMSLVALWGHNNLQIFQCSQQKQTKCQTNACASLTDIAKEDAVLKVAACRVKALRCGEREGRRALIGFALGRFLHLAGRCSGKSRHKERLERGRGHGSEHAYGMAVNMTRRSVYCMRSLKPTALRRAATAGPNVIRN